MDIVNLPCFFTVIDAKMSFAERCLYALRVSLIGMVAVFGVLALIWGILTLLRLFIEFVEKAKTRKKKNTVPEESADIAEEEISGKAADDGELIAVITAAVMAARADEAEKNGCTQKGFRVVSFKRSESFGMRK